MSKLKFLIVEDEPTLAKRLKKKVIEIGYDVAAIAYNMSDAVKFYNDINPDVVILDIELPEDKLAGIELAKIFRKTNNAPILFYTQHSDEHVLNIALGAKPDGFIKKSSGIDQLIIDIKIAIRNYFQNEDSIDEESIWVYSKKIYQRIFWKEISYIESKDRGVIIHTDDDDYPFSKTLKKFEEEIISSDFLRIQRSYIVNLRKVDGYDSTGMYLIVKQNDKKVNVGIGEDYLSIVKSHMNIIRTRKI